MLLAMTRSKDSYVNMPISQDGGTLHTYTSTLGLHFLFCTALITVMQICSSAEIQVGHTIQHCNSATGQLLSMTVGKECHGGFCGAACSKCYPMYEVRLCEARHPLPPWHSASWSVSSHRPSESQPAPHQNLVMFVFEVKSTSFSYASRPLCWWRLVAVKCL